MFKFKKFLIHQDRCAMKVTTDSCLFGAWVADYLRVHPLEGKALDIGAGTGLLSMMVAQKTQLSFDAIELDPSAAAQARENVASSPFSERIKIIEGNVLEAQEKLETNYNVIISNPPFYENDLVSPDNRKNQAHHDHSLRLEGLLGVVHQHLAPHGQFFVLLPFRRWEEFRKSAGSFGLSVASVLFVRQTSRHDYFRVLIRCQHKTEREISVQEDELVIREEGDDYSGAFVFLLKDYYLYL